LSKESCDFLLTSSRAEDVGEGQIVYEAESRADAMYVIWSGEVELLRSVDDVKVQLNSLRAGETFGEQELIDMQRRGYSVITARPSVLFRIEYDALCDMRSRFSKDFTIFTLNAARQMSRRLRDLDVERGEMMIELAQR